MNISESCAKILNKENLQCIFPAERTFEFFEALLGDASEGAYDIELAYRAVENETEKQRLIMEFRLNQRQGCCLACNLTSGLPQVFSRHPIIGIDDIVKAIDNLFGKDITCGTWMLGATEQRSEALHIVPLYIEIV